MIKVLLKLILTKYFIVNEESLCNSFFAAIFVQKSFSFQLFEYFKKSLFLLLHFVIILVIKIKTVFTNNARINIYQIISKIFYKEFPKNSSLKLP